MPKVLLINRDKATLGLLEAMFRPHFEVKKTTEVTAGASLLTKSRPDLVVVGQEAKSDDALRLATWMRDNGVQLPVVAVLGPKADPVQPKLHKLGVRAFVEHPITKQQVQEAINTAVRFHKTRQAAPPPPTLEELRANLSELENRLNKAMKCFAGTNKVFILSQIGSTSRPRICLKCPLRPEYGLPPNVYYEFIRDVCCGDPNKCEAYYSFQTARESA
ncbi:MAG TPA: response regulator [Phycisphaerae bacterium]|nr:response regulator [Phycisphaerae bacterium]HRR84833.1 response regulator [Phycisphaerae bacterium]